MKINFTKKVLLTSSVALAMSQAVGAPSSRIIGGSQATTGSYPWVVSLKGSSGDHFCGASLIAKQWVLTAAHCVEEETASSVSVVVGEFNTAKEDNGEQKRKVTKIVIHPQYGKGAESNNDIALLKLDTPVSNQIVTQVVPSIMNKITVGSLLTVMGWGNQSSTGEEFPNKLFQVEVPLVTNQQCARNYAVENIDITENMICAGFKQGGKDSCQGDSGGPLLYQLDGTWQQVGIVSFGQGCALPDFPGVYARVGKYNDWVNKQIGATTTTPALVTNPMPVEPETPEPETPEVPSTAEPTMTVLASLDLPEEIELIALDNQQEESVLKMKNKTAKNINVVDISVNEASFEIAQNDCIKVIKPGDSCELALSYRPDFYSEDAQGDLIIDFDDGTNVTLALIGNNLDAVDETVNDNQTLSANDGIDWYLDSDVWYEDNNGFSLDSSELELNGFATMSAELEGEGAFEFDFDFENDSNENYCSYYVDGKLVRTVKGANKNVSHHVTQLSKGKHKIVWVYKKKSENTGKLKIKNIKLSKSQAATNQSSTQTTSSATTTTAAGNALTSTSNNETTPTSSLNRSGGGSTDILLLSGLLLLLGRTRKLFVKR